MRRIKTANLKPEMVVARTIIDSDSRVLLNSGMPLNDKYIERLSELGIASIYIKDGLLDDEAQVYDIVSEKTRTETIKVIKSSFTHLEKNSNFNVEAVKNLVKNIIAELLENRNTLLHLTDIRSFDDYTFGHSVNVCILSIITALTLGYSEPKLKELGLGALLHDIGKTRIDKEILNKPGDLTPEEFNEIKRHTDYGFAILRNYPDVSLLSAHIAFQHHERWDGNGYPRGLVGSEIHHHSRIVAAADVYDALLADRPYRPAYNVTQALNILTRMAGSYLDFDCVMALKSNVAIYPVGSFVQLTTGDICIVVDANKNNPTRPKLKIILDKDKKRLSHPREIDLSRLKTIMITRPIHEEEIPFS